MKRKTQQETSVEQNPQKLKKIVDFPATKIDANGTNTRISKTTKKNVESKTKKEKTGRFEKSLLKKTGKISQKKTRTDKNGKFGIVINNNSTLKETTNWIQLKKRKKELREKRKERKMTGIYEISVQAKKIGEKLRRSDCTPEERHDLTKMLHKLLKTHYDKVIFTHDMSRLIQWLLKYCEPNIRDEVFVELKSSLISMTESKYAKNCVKNFLKYGSPELKRKVISEWYGNIVKLMSHSVSAPLIELAYSTWATNEDKTYFKQEFYGDIYKQAKDKTINTLTDVFKTAEGMKSATLSAVKNNLIKIINKQFIRSTLLQSVLWEFLTHCSNADKSEIIVMLRNSIVELASTKVGSKVATLCIWYGNNKDRKNILKSLKDHVKVVATSEHGYMVLLALIDSLDDTVLMKKILLSEIQKDLTEIALNEHGKHVILYLIARRDPHYFPPAIVDYLKQGDNNEVSKKPADIREKELRDAVIDPFLTSIATDVATWLSTGSISMVTLAMLKAGSGENLKLALQSVANYITHLESKIVDENTEYNVIEHPSLHMMLKKLIQHDKNIEQQDNAFGNILNYQLTTQILNKWVTFNRGCFLLILLIENESESVTKNLLQKLEEVKQRLKKQKSPGASILLKKLSKK